MTAAIAIQHSSQNVHQTYYERLNLLCRTRDFYSMTILGFQTHLKIPSSPLGFLRLREAETGPDDKNAHINPHNTFKEQHTNFIFSEEIIAVQFIRDIVNTVKRTCHQHFDLLNKRMTGAGS